MMTRRTRALVARLGTGSFCFLFAVNTYSDFTVRQIADESFINREPVISDTGLVAWQGFRLGVDATPSAEIFVYTGETAFALTEGVIERFAGNNSPQVYSNQLVWVTTISQKPPEYNWILRDPPLQDDQPEPDARFRVAPGSDNIPELQILEKVGGTNWVLGADTPDEDDPRLRSRRNPSGDNEIMFWNGGDITRITADNRNDLGPGLWGDMIAWQKARGWPYGWEIMIWDGSQQMQITTNYYYDMAPKVHNNQVAWYGWDGTDYEIFLYDHATQTTTQITDNAYDDVSPRIWDGVIVWEAFPSLHADIFMYSDGEIRQLSNNVEDDMNPSLWNGQVVWQSFDGDFFQIYHFDGTRTHQLTNTRYDNVNPHIRDGLIVWMGYVDNMDAEIFVWNGGPDPIRLTDNDHEDQHVRTAGGRVIWQADFEGKSHIYLAEPR